MNEFELRELRCFIAVMEEASFVRTATSFHAPRAGVSAQVGRLVPEPE
jgi:DNA-binding transcriptional LysR family regulator